jgi:hypothetical protein
VALPRSPRGQPGETSRGGGLASQSSWTAGRDLTRRWPCLAVLVDSRERPHAAVAYRLGVRSTCSPPVCIAWPYPPPRPLMFPPATACS